MTKYLLKLATIIGMYVFLVGTVSAANLSVQIEQPKSPSNLSSFDVNFVALDISNRPVTVKCFKKGPTDSSFSQFGSDISLTAGGNTDNCNVTSSILSAAGVYNFYVTATAGSDSIDSSTVSVDFNNSTPGAPGNYSKEKISSCDYKIKFKTADDGGKTSKVVIYRSDQTSFTADAGTEIVTIVIGSNTEGEYTNSVPDCNKTYYFALRAFSTSGNGSGTVSDSFTTVVTSGTTTQTTTTTSGTGVVPVAQSQVTEGSILGTTEATASEEGVLGEEATPGAEVQASPNPTAEPGLFTKLLTFRNLIYILLGALVVYFLYRRYRK